MSRSSATVRTAVKVSLQDLMPSANETSQQQMLNLRMSNDLKDNLLVSFLLCSLFTLLIRQNGWRGDYQSADTLRCALFRLDLGKADVLN